jgi:hypothetical protein
MKPSRTFPRCFAQSGMGLDRWNSRTDLTFWFNFPQVLKTELDVVENGARSIK